jgi:hypothetical protein
LGSYYLTTELGSYYEPIEDEADLGGRRPHVNHNNVHTLLHNQRNNKAMSFKPGDTAIYLDNDLKPLVTVHSECIDGFYMVQREHHVPTMVAARSLQVVPKEPNITIKVYAPGIQEVPDMYGSPARAVLQVVSDVVRNYSYSGKVAIDVTWPNTQTVRYNIEA